MVKRLPTAYFTRSDQKVEQPSMHLENSRAGETCADGRSPIN